MSTIEAKPVKAKRILNTKLLPIAALLLVLLALLFLAAPLIRTAGRFQRSGNFVIQTTGQGASQNGVPAQGNGSTLPTQRMAVGGRAGIIVYFVMLLVSLAAAVGMLLPKRWAQVLGIILAVLYGLLGLLSLLPLLLTRLPVARNPVSLILGVIHLLLAVAVIVLASIPGKPAAAPMPAVPAAGM
jgi:hypothetical protein